MSVKDFSTTPASNATVGAINFAELQVPSSLNDSARNLMADIKEWYNEITGGTRSGTVGGTADAITLTTTPTLSAYAVNQRFLVKVTAANTSTAPTLNVSGLGAKTIKLPGGAALAASQWVTGDILLLAYDGTDLIVLSGDSARGNPVASLTRNAQTGTTYTVVSGDRSKHVTFSNAATVAVTLPQATGSFGSGWYAWVENVGVGTATITPTTSTINGGTALVLRTGEWGLITSDGTNYRTFTNARVTGAGSVREIGTRGLPVFTQDTTYQFAFGDEGCIIRHSSASAHTYTIPANSGTAFPVGTAITIVNEPGAGAITLTITTDTLNRGDGIAGTGNRTIGVNAVVTIIKTAATTWMITGKFT
jgi:hypothetical protein